MAERRDFVNFHLLPFSTLEFGEKFLLISPRSGSYFVCDSELHQRIVCNQIDEDLAMKLFQLGLAEIDDAASWSSAAPQRVIKPLFFLIDVTTNCNLGCIYCFRDIREGLIDYGDLNVILNYIESYCQENGVTYIFVQPWGGEPLLAYDRIYYIHDFFACRGIRCDLTFQTNGTRITVEMAKELKRIGARIGVSLDGLEFTHNVSRPFRGGQGSYRSVLEGIHALLKGGYKSYEIGAIVVLNQTNIDCVEEIVENFAKEFGFRNIKVNYTIDNPHIKRSVCITPQQYASAQINILETMIRLRSEGFVIAEENIRIKAQNILFGGRRDICRSAGCQGGYRMIAFDREGGIYPCDVTDNPLLRIGNINDGSPLIKVIESASKTHSFFLTSNSQRCECCPWHSYCMSGCRSAQYYTSGETGGFDAFECESNRTLYPYLFQMFLENPNHMSLFG